MATNDGKLGIARLQFGNVVLMPQNAAGSGDNSFQVIHGTNMAPPHTYIASYLWMQHGFKADALIISVHMEVLNLLPENKWHCAATTGRIAWLEQFRTSISTLLVMLVKE